MEHYIIRDSLNLKIVGHFPQSIDAKYHCPVWDEPKFIEHHELIPLDFEPIVANAILHKKAKITDLISPSAMGFTRKLLLSGKLKTIIESKIDKSDVQFFRSPVIYNSNLLDDYWLLYANKENNNFINFEESDIFLMEGVTDEVEKLNIKSFENYSFIKNDIEKKGYPHNILIKNYKLLDNSPHFLALNKVSGGIQYLVSEKLKQQIEAAGCTGIEFQPSELTYNEWVASGEREKIYGKS